MSRILLDGQARQVAGDLQFPNGMVITPDHETLFLLAAEWRGIELVDEAVAARTGQVLSSRAPAPGAGWP